MSRKTRKSGSVGIYLRYGLMHAIQPDLWSGDVLLEIDTDPTFNYPYPCVFTLTWRHSTQASSPDLGQKLLEVDWMTAAAGAIVPRMSRELRKLGYTEDYARNRAEALKDAINVDLCYEHSPQWRRLAEQWSKRNTRADIQSHARAWHDILGEFKKRLPAMPAHSLPEAGELSDWERELLS